MRLDGGVGFRNYVTNRERAQVSTDNQPLFRTRDVTVVFPLSWASTTPPNVGQENYARERWRINERQSRDPWFHHLAISTGVRSTEDWSSTTYLYFNTGWVFTDSFPLRRIILKRLELPGAHLLFHPVFAFAFLDSAWMLGFCFCFGDLPKSSSFCFISFGDASRNGVVQKDQGRS